MGILSDGTPFLTQRGLAKLCGVENAHIGSISAQWNDSIELPRIRKIREILERHGSQVSSPHVEAKVNGTVVFAYCEKFCLAVLEYYAFEAGHSTQQEAIQNYRLLAGKGFREFIYSVLGYRPDLGLDERWRPFIDRVSLAYNAAPLGYFSIFREISDMAVSLAKSGILMSDKVVPDISVGRGWSEYWQKNRLEQKYGSRCAYQHNYPDYFPQSASNPQHPWCYPEEALHEFRSWLRREYMAGGAFRRYLTSQVDKGRIEANVAERVLSVTYDH